MRREMLRWVGFTAGSAFVAGALLAPAADAAVVICKRKNKIQLRETACKSKETQIATTELGATGPPGTRVIPPTSSTPSTSRRSDRARRSPIGAALIVSRRKSARPTSQYPLRAPYRTVDAGNRVRRKPSKAWWGSQRRRAIRKRAANVNG